MTEQQLLTAVPGAVRMDKPDAVNHAAIHIPSFDLAGVAFQVYFIPDQAGKLTSVLLIPTRDPAEGLDSLFQRLQNLLVEKYGRPWSSNGSGTDQKQWTRPTSVITLSLNHLRTIRLTTLNLEYKQKSADLDKM